MLQINVALPNGHAEPLTLLPSSTVQDLRTKAQRAFGKKRIRLITAKNRLLVNFEQTLEEADIEDGECLTVLVLQQQLAATGHAFALWCHGDSAVVTWGCAGFGGDSSAVRDQLRGVQQIRATDKAFAAILEDRSVVTWGASGCGGDSSAVRDQLKGVQQILHLLLFWQMDQSLPGAVQTMVVTVRQLEISSRVCSRFKPQNRPLLRFWQMDLSSPGVMRNMAVTVRQFEIS